MDEVNFSDALILTIDDEKTIRDSFKHFLEDYGFEVIGAENGRAGLELFDRQTPDLVLVDLRMPEMDGLQVLDYVVKKDPEVPVIVVSGTGVISDVIEALHLGAWDYMLKPVQDLTVLLHSIRKNLERRQLRRQSRDYQAHLEQEVVRQTERLVETNSEMQQINNRLRQGEEKYRSIFESLTDVYFQVTLDGQIEELSPSVLHNLSYQREGLLGQVFWSLFVEPDQCELFQDLLEKGGIVLEFEAFLTDGEGGAKPCSLSARKEVYPDGCGGRIYGTLRDVSERKSTLR